MKQSVLKILALLLLFLWHENAHAGGYALRFGPPSVGRGGSNPLGIPPQVVDTQLAYVSKSKFEGSLSVTGVFAGFRRDSSWGGYVSLGGGLALDANGTGLGVYSSFGIDFACSDLICASFEYSLRSWFRAILFSWA